ncbi:hypothetical protein N7G274_008146 [Stereocaulon virgatum]|uniref:Uncharacterized protein n=1 Tax=Stereocaulon virgatum TaxID=373712 RepID=A0ABR3ZZI1_9LECA
MQRRKAELEAMMLKQSEISTSALAQRHATTVTNHRDVSGQPMIKPSASCSRLSSPPLYRQKLQLSDQDPELPFPSNTH